MSIWFRVIACNDMLQVHIAFRVTDVLNVWTDREFQRWDFQTSRRFWYVQYNLQVQWPLCIQHVAILFRIARVFALSRWIGREGEVHWEWTYIEKASVSRVLVHITRQKGGVQRFFSLIAVFLGTIHLFFSAVTVPLPTVIRTKSSWALSNIAGPQRSQTFYEAFDQLVQNV